MDGGEILSLLEAERAIRWTIAMQNRALDDEDWEGLRTYLSTDFQLQGVDPPVVGADMALALMKQLTAQTDGTRFQHTLQNMIVTVSVDEAHASAFQTVYRYRPDVFSSPLSKLGSQVSYVLRREYGSWKITSFAFVRLWIEGEPS
jgi:hypothetical protein